MLCASTNNWITIGIRRNRSSKDLSTWFYKNGTEFQMIDQRIHGPFERSLQQQLAFGKRGLRTGQ
jgi:hypothetical protein